MNSNNEKTEKKHIEQQVKQQWTNGRNQIENNSKKECKRNTTAYS
jgi:hypothetical protein